MKTKILLFAALIFTLGSCVEDKVNVEYILYTDEEYQAISSVLSLPNEQIDYEVKLPQHMEKLGMTPPQISNAKATLGRVLFYDTRLSRNESVSCASCHKQELAFSDDVAFSEGFDGQVTKRNSLALGAVANFKSSYEGGGGDFGIPSGQQQLFFWDERAHSIQQQTEMTIEDDIEMGMELGELASRLAEAEHYRVLFRKAYNTDVIQPHLITDAMQEFINAMVSTQSRFDDGFSSPNRTEFDAFSNFTQQENQGKALFIKHCSSCHGSNMSISPERVAHNGLDQEYTDLGVGGITGFPGDIGKFKVPFLRNIALTAPYMHDGRFATLGEVVEHYNSGIRDHQNLDHRLRDPETGQPLRLNLNEEEKAAIVAFLGTLTDEELVKAPRFSDPFK